MTGAATTEPAHRRLEALRSFDPLLRAWVDEGLLTNGEADLAVLAAEASERRRPLRLTLPGGSSQLAAALAAHAAVRKLTHPGRYPDGPTTLVAGSRARSLVTNLTVNGSNVTGLLGAARLRTDGRAQLVSKSTPEPLTAALRFLVVSPLSRWPRVDLRLGVAVIDELSLGEAYEDAHAWAVQHAELVHVVAPLDPNRQPASYEVTWPHVGAEPIRWGRKHAWPLCGEVRVVLAGPGPVGIDDVRRRVADAPMDQTWPAPLTLAAGLSRSLASLAVPVSLYDLHTAHSIAVPFAERIEALKEAGPGSFPDTWAGFASTDWVPMKRRLLEAAESLEEFNPKAERAGSVVEQLLANGAAVDVWVESEVHARALQDHLVSAGFAVMAEHLDNGALAIRPYRDATRPLDHPRVSVLTGLPASWHLPALLSGGVGGPLTVVAYDFEASRLPGLIGWALNNAARERHRERHRVVTDVLGEGITEVAEPPSLRLALVSSSDEDERGAAPIERLSDAAEFAALADDEWLSIAIQEREQAAGEDDVSLRPARAFLVDPGPSVLIVASNAVVDRLVGGRLRPTPALSLLPGMQLFAATHATQGAFVAIRPQLDRVRGTGTRFWLDQWDDALRAALEKTGSAPALAEALAGLGTSITAASVASWPSPYRIGPRDRTNVERVARIGGNKLVAHHYQRVHTVMRGVRAEHASLGRQLAGAIRAHMKGDAGAFDMLNDRYGVDIEELLGDPSVLVITQHLADGAAPHGALGHTFSVKDVQTIFQPQEAT